MSSLDKTCFPSAEDKDGSDGHNRFDFQEPMKAASLGVRTGSVGAGLSSAREAAASCVEPHSQPVSKPSSPCRARSAHACRTPFSHCCKLDDEFRCPPLRSFHSSSSEDDADGRCGNSEAEADEDDGCSLEDLRSKRASFGTASCFLLTCSSSTALHPAAALSRTLEPGMGHTQHSTPSSSTAPASPQAEVMLRPQQPQDSGIAEVREAAHEGETAEDGALSVSGARWAEVPDDVLGGICRHMPRGYVRVVRLVCKGWAGAAGRLMQRLKPEILDGPRLAERFPYLRALDLSHCLHSVTFHSQTALQLRSNMSDELIALLAPLGHLRELSLRGCTQLRGSPGSGFSRLLSLKSLRSLDISNCEGLQDDAMQVVGQMTGLRQLRMTGCKALTDAALVRMSRLQRLTQLELGGNANFTDTGVAVLSRLQGLQQVSLLSLAQVTNQGVSTLAVLPNLKRMTVSRCPNICETGLQEVFVGRQLRVIMCGTPLRRSMCAWMSSVLADLDNLLFENR